MHVREVHETLPSQTTLKAFFKFDDGEADEYFPGSGWPQIDHRFGGC
jgi:hypothetical protein